VKYCSFKQSLERPATCSAGVSGVLFLLIFLLFDSASAGDVQGSTAKDLEGITIRSAWFPSGTVTLINGEYRGPAAPGSVIETVVRLTDRRAFGPMNGKDSAAIVLATDTGGSGLFYDLALIVKGSGGWVYADAILLGDRVKVHSVGIKDNKIIVSMTAHGPGDAMCCPTNEMIRLFTVQADHLVAERDARPGSPDPRIIGIVWQWVRTRYHNDITMNRPADTAGYTLQLNSDGTVKVRGDCNAGGGSFTMTGSNVSVRITHTTMAACPKGSRESSFIRDVNGAAGFLLKNGMLFLDLENDTGTMEFHEKQKNPK